MLDDKIPHTAPAKSPVLNRSLAAFLAFLLLIQLRSDRGPQQDGSAWSTSEGLRLVAMVHSLIRQRSLNAPNNERLFQAAIDGMLRTVDRHSRYLPPLVAQQTDMALRGGARGLIGILHAFAPGFGVRILGTLPDFPAERAGVKDGDLITKVQGVQLAGLSYAACLRMMGGAPGEDVRLTIVRGQNELSFVLTRKAFHPLRVRVNRLLERDHRIAYVRFSVFSLNADRYLGEAIKRLQQAGLQALVLDLRDNGGGELHAGLAVADLFLPRGKLITTLEYRKPGKIAERTRQPYLAKTASVGDFPLVILINGHTASASELVTSALQDHGRAIVVGERSYGKARIQEIREISSGRQGAVNMTTGRYLTPKGRDLERTTSRPPAVHGIAPDYVVPMSNQEADARRRYFRMQEIGISLAGEQIAPDPQLDQAVRLLQQQLNEK